MLKCSGEHGQVDTPGMAYTGTCMRNCSSGAISLYDIDMYLGSCGYEAMYDKDFFTKLLQATCS